MALHLLRCGLTIGLVLVCIATAHAAEKTPPGYKEAVSEALSELEAGNYPEARQEFRRAHAIFPNARTLRGMGMVEFELRNYTDSVRLLREALTSQVKALDDKLRQETELLLARAQRYLGELQLTVDPANASVLIDGAPIQLQAGQPLVLEVGEHVIDVRAPGKLSERRTIKLEGEARTDLRIALLAPPPPPPPVAAAAPPSEDKRSDSAPQKQPVYKKWWFWTSLVLVVGGSATATALLIMRDKEADPAPMYGENTIGVSLHSLRQF